MRSIHTRLKMLEILHSVRLHSCKVCGYPQHALRRIFHSRNNGPLERCRSCRQPLDDDGVPLHTPLVRIMRGVRLFNEHTRTR